MGGNLEEIRPLGTEAQKWKNLKKWGSSEVAIMENTFQKMAYSRKIGKAKIPRNCSRRKSDRNLTAVGVARKWRFTINGTRRKR